MRRAKYKGVDCHMGRFGEVRRGAVLEMTEKEANSTLNNPDFIFERVTVEEGFPVGQLPPAGKYYDVSRLPWENFKIWASVDRMGRSRLTNALMQLEASGYPVPKLRGLSAEQMRDLLMETGRKAGWV